MPDVPETTLLRFLHVRPVQARDDRAPHAPILTLGPHRSELIDALGNAKTHAEATLIAQRHIRSDRYVPGFGARLPWVDPLREVWMALASIDDEVSWRTARTRIKAIAARVESPGTTSSIPALRLLLWESLVAAFVAPREDPRDRADLIRMIRAIESLHVPEHLTSGEAAMQLAVARPVVPRQHLRWSRPTQGADDNGSAGGGTGPIGGLEPHPIDRGDFLGVEELLGKVNPLRERVLALDLALADLELQQRRAHGANASTDPTPPIVSPPSPTGVVTARTPQASSKRLAASAVSRLQPATIKTVESAGLSLAEDRIADVISILRDRKSDTMDQLYRLGGVSAMGHIDVENVLLEPGDFEHHIPIPFPQGFERPIEGSVGTVRPLGIGDLLILRETVLGYALGEIAYIENVLQSELRSRVHRRLDRTETTFSTTTTQSETTERDLTTNERFQLATEVERTVQTDMSLNVGLGVSASYGVVKVDANTDFAISSSVTESQRSATEYSQEITERAVSSLTKSISETLTQTVLNEVEETNTHTFDNTAGTGHIAGLYRFVDKNCEGQVFNYGKRLMMEFIIPEPAAFHLHGQQNPPPPTVTITEPEPLPSDFGFKKITREDYHIWVREYQVAGVEPPPPVSMVIGKAIEQPSTVDELKGKEWTVTTRTDVLSVPAGYVATQCYVVGSWSYFDIADYEMVAVVGRSYLDLRTEYEEPMSNENAEIPVAIKAKNVRAFAFTVQVECQCTNEHLVAWKIDTWQKVVDAYNTQRAAWEAQIASREIQQGNAQNTIPPSMKRDIAESELRKGCLVLLTNQHFASMDAVAPEASPFGYPELRVAEAMQEGSYMQYFEQCFEWTQVTYTYYPYFWGSKTDWVARSQMSDSDPAFADFLRAGAARVLVPVRPGYEESLMYYLETGTIWNGGEAPLIDDELYVSIVDEMAAARDVSLDSAEPYGEAWSYALPTTLVMLQGDSTLPTFTPAVT